MFNRYKGESYKLTAYKIRYGNWETSSPDGRLTVMAFPRPLPETCHTVAVEGEDDCARFLKDCATRSEAETLFNKLRDAGISKENPQGRLSMAFCRNLGMRQE